MRWLYNYPVDKSFAVENVPHVITTKCIIDHSLYAMQKVERRWTKKKEEIRYLFPFDKAELLLVTISFSGFSYRAFSRTNSIGESSILLNFIIWGHI